jgi:transcriptional regulator with PAS, ATPase and Fis domain
VDRVAPKTLPVLILGESGTGKELIARQAHEGSKRKSGPFIVVNCGAIPKDLSESILFGFEKGAFTGAAGAQPGKFEQAHGGTIFLDELGELPLDQQVKLLRVLQEGMVERIGGIPKKIDVRVVAATNRNLREMMAEGMFREDLYYRVSGLEVTLPPLRERGNDIVVLAEEMLTRAVAKHKLERLTFSDDARDAVLSHDWPGNVRELERVVETAAVLACGAVITKSDIAGRLRGAPQPQSKLVDVSRRPALAGDAAPPAASLPAARRDVTSATATHEDVDAEGPTADRAARVASALLVPRRHFTRAEFGERMGLNKTQSKTWLKYLVDGGLIRSCGRGPATRYEAA